ncbi:MAG: hypothetical protein WDM84_08980 [Bauldia sp.]
MRSWCPSGRGTGTTGGPYLEEQGACDNPDFAGSGLATADSIGAVVSFMARQPFIKPTGAIVVGNSAGGWGALALASRNPKGVAAVVSFAGGRGGHKGNRAGANCAPDRLVAAAATYGQTAHIPFALALCGGTIPISRRSCRGGWRTPIAPRGQRGI